MRDWMDKNEYLYDAFISYRHTEKDKFVAETLHRELENYKLPRNLAKIAGERGKVKINRIFRDRDELPIASNLAAPITEALEASEFLVVICSPRLPESDWCRIEIETFIQMHDRDHILAVLIEGEPDDSFPEILRIVEQKRVNRDGSVTVDKIPVEPLAADVRGDTRREIRKKIKEEVIRLAAPMFDCAYDDLKQRHRERRIRRTLLGAAVIGSVGLLFGTVSSILTFRIHRQNIEISQQSEQIALQSEEIHQQYWTAMEAYAEREADRAQALLADGDRAEAVRTARVVLPDSLASPDKPYTYAAEYALSDSLGVYATGEYTIADFMLKHKTNVSWYQLSPAKDRLLVVDDAGTIYVWDMENGDLLYESSTFRDVRFAMDQAVDFLDNNTLFLPADESGITIEIETGTSTEWMPESGDWFDGYGMKIFRKTKRIAVWNQQEIVIYEFEGGRVLCRYQAEEGWQINRDLTFSEDGNRSAFSMRLRDGEAWDWDAPWLETQVLVMDHDSAEISDRFTVKREEVADLSFDGDILYVVNSEVPTLQELGNLFLNPMEGLVYAYDLVEKEVKWSFSNPDGTLDEAITPAGNDDALLLCTGYETTYLIDKQDGSLAGAIGFGDDIVHTAVSADGEVFAIYAENGHIYYILPERSTREAIEYSYRFQSNSDHVKQMENGLDGTVIVLPYSSANVTVFKPKTGEQNTEIFSQNTAVSHITMSPDGDVYLVGSDEATGIYAAETDEKIGSMHASASLDQFAFIGTDKELIASLIGNTLYLNDRRTGSQVGKYELGGLNLFFIGDHSEQIFCFGGREAVLFDTWTGQEISRVEVDEVLMNPYQMTVSGEKRLLACIYDEENIVKIISLEDMENLKNVQNIQELELNTAFISHLFFDPSGTILYVSYKDNSLEAYTCENEIWSLKKSYGVLSEGISAVLDVGDGRRSILRGTIESWLLKDGEIVARFPDFKAVIRDINGKYFLYNSYSGTIRKVPLYEYDMLLEEAAGYVTHPY